MSRSKKNQRAHLTASIMRQTGEEANVRYMRSLPIFRVDLELPEDMREMLEKMEREGVHDSGRQSAPHRGFRK
jgi:hypothetical protein